MCLMMKVMAIKSDQKNPKGWPKKSWKNINKIQKLYNNQQLPKGWRKSWLSLSESLRGELLLQVLHSPTWAEANWRSTQVKTPGQRSHPQNWNVIDKIGASARKGHTVSETRAHSRFGISISLFLSHAWLCLQVSLWIFWSWSNNWWATGPCTQWVKRTCAHSRLIGSIYLFLSHSWQCLQVSLWNFCVCRSFWWPTGPCT